MSRLPFIQLKNQNLRKSKTSNTEKKTTKLFPTKKIPKLKPQKDNKASSSQSKTFFLRKKKKTLIGTWKNDENCTKSFTKRNKTTFFQKKGNSTTKKNKIPSISKTNPLNFHHKKQNSNKEHPQRKDDRFGQKQNPFQPKNRQRSSNSNFPSCSIRSETNSPDLRANFTKLKIKSKSQNQSKGNNEGQLENPQKQSSQFKDNLKKRSSAKTVGIYKCSSFPSHEITNKKVGIKKAKIKQNRVFQLSTTFIPIDQQDVDNNESKFQNKKEIEHKKDVDHKENNQDILHQPTSLFSPSKLINKRKVSRSFSLTPQEIVLKRGTGNQQVILTNPKKRIRKTKITRSNSLNLLFEPRIDPKIWEKQKPALPVTKGKPIELNTISPETLCDLLDGSYKKKYGIEFSDVIVIDCRFDWEYEGGHIAGAKNWNVPRVLFHKLFCKEIRENVCLVFHCEFSQHRGPKMCKLLRRTDRKINVYPNLHYPQLYVLEKGYKEFFKHSDRSKKFCCPQGYRKMLNKQYQTQMHEDSRKFKLNLKIHQKRKILSLDDILNWYGSLKQPITIKHNQVKRSSNLRTSLSLSQEANTTTTLTKKNQSLSLSQRDNTNFSLCRKRPLQSLNSLSRGYTLSFDSRITKCQEVLFNDDLDPDFESNYNSSNTLNIKELENRFKNDTNIDPKKNQKKFKYLYSSSI
ncbi:cdc25-like protein phosphatase twine-related [Anaeramoeba flamelloides]|uniref:protein-tyrosine-phosphatase n=1 Tax=Anaeramoeba flamelloides TaxID=1746091 RepID=A0ABQ8Y8T9_9EUKA|nr:cdc25-like protein phosphatase twine-related [Anaeramoeba flamelloides]